MEAHAVGRQYWLAHPDLVAVPYHQIEQVGESWLFRSETGEEQTIPANAIGKLSLAFPDQLGGKERLEDLEEVHKEAVLHSIRVRFERDDIYTCIQKILIAVNPFQNLPIYDAEKKKQYRNAADSALLAPHVYGIALDAINGVRRVDPNAKKSLSGKASQAVLISGESGAGKTETAKHVMNFSCSLVGGGSTRVLGIQDKILQTNPVLEAFGNAMTPRNNNSSRFGKWVQMSVNSAGIRGCSITEYMLELPRVCNPGAHDRNYHIFFQLIEKRAEEFLQPLQIKEPGEYRYLDHSNLKAPQIDDADGFESTKLAFGDLDFSDEQQLDIFKITIGVLTLGNIAFEDSDGAAQLASNGAADEVARLLGVERELLCGPMLARQLKIAGEITEKTCNSQEARAIRDSLARLLYHQLFKWLICQVNDMLSQDVETEQFFGVLDIAGFESFQENSLEQLFINLTNEILQKQFTDFVFEQEQMEYKAEGINGVTFPYEQNNDIIDLINAKEGIFSILDDTLSFASATDQTFVNNLKKKHEKHKRFVPGRGPELRFGVKHFAGQVNYGCKGFLEKDRDRPPEHASALMCGSRVPILQDMGKKLEAALAERSGGGAGASRKGKTLCSTFKQQLKELQDKLRKAEPHFIRCVKPNTEKVPKMFTSTLVMEQLEYSGVISALLIRQQGFPCRLTGKDFCERYRLLLSSVTETGNEEEDTRKFVKELLDAYSNPPTVCDESLRFGKTKVFTKGHTLKALDNELRRVLLKRLEDAIEAKDMQRLQRELEICEPQLPLTDLQPAKQALARDKLKAALAGHRAGPIREAIDQAYKCGLDEPLVQQAQLTLVEEEKKEVVRDNLEEAVRVRKSQPLRTALSEARAAGLSPEEMQAAEKILQEEEEKALMRQRLVGAKSSCDPEAVRQVIAQAEALEGFDMELIEDAKKQVVVLEKRSAAKTQLGRAMKSPDAETLRKAIAECEEVGLPAESELLDAKAALQVEEEKEKVRLQLQEAVRIHEMDPLLAALKRAREINLPAKEMQEAQKALKKEEEKQKVREELKVAIQSRQVHALVVAIKKAEELGLKGSEVQEANQVMAVEVRKNTARSGLEEATRTRAMQALRDAIAEAKAAGLEPHEMEEAQRALAEEERKIAAKSALQDAARHLDKAAFQAAVDEGKACGLAACVFQEAENAWAEAERKALARELLAQAVDNRQIENLQAALAEGVAAGLERRELDEANKVLMEEQRKVEARKRLAVAVQQRGIAALKSALEKAEAAGLSSGELAEAQKTLAQEERKEVARQVLAEACRSRGIQALEEALAEASTSGLADGELRDAQRILREEQRKQAAHRALSEAVSLRDINTLLEAIDEGQAAGLARSELQLAQEVLEEEQRLREARLLLAEAVSNRSIRSLQVALDEAEQAGIEEAEMAEAKQVLLQEEQRAKARIDLDSAINSRDVAALRAAVAAGALAKVDVAELDVARKVLATEEARATARAALQEATRCRTLAALRGAIAEGEATGIDSAELQVVRAILVEEERKAEARAFCREALMTRQLDLLQAAVVKAQAASLPEAEIEEVQEVLTSEEQKISAREALKVAVCTRELDALSAAIRQAAKVGLAAPEVQEATEICAAERRKLQIRADIKEMARCTDVQELRAFVAECWTLGLEAWEYNVVKNALTREEGRELARRALRDAVRVGGVEGLKKVIREGEIAGLEETDLQEARMAVKREEQRSAIVLMLQEASQGKDMNFLRMAISQAEGLGLEPWEVSPARQRLVALERQELAMKRLEKAVMSPGIDVLKGALAQAEDARVEERHMAAAKEVLMTQLKAAARIQLERAQDGLKHNELLSAISAGHHAGLQESELQDSRDRLEEAVEQSFSAVRDHLLPITTELSFEIARRSLQVKGMGGMRCKVGEPALLCDFDIGMRLSKKMEELWFQKAGGLLAELRANLRAGATTQKGEVGHAAAVTNRQLSRLAMEVKQRCGGKLHSARLAEAPLAQLCMLLYTQQEADTDRLLFFSDCPSPWSAEEAEGSSSLVDYKSYRERVNGAGLDRNAMASSLLAVASEDLLGLVCGEKIQERSRQDFPTLRSWIKVFCLLGAARGGFSTPKTVFRGLTQLLPGTLQELESKKLNDVFVWAGPLSTTADRRVAQDCLAEVPSAHSKMQVLLMISGVREGLDVSVVSQYPDELEVVLPPLSVLRVLWVRTCDRRPCLEVACEFQGTLMTEKLVRASSTDLHEGMAELLRELEVSTSSLSSPRTLSPCASTGRGATTPVITPRTPSSGSGAATPRSPPCSRPHSQLPRGGRVASLAKRQPVKPSSTAARAVTPAVVREARSNAPKPSAYGKDDFRVLYNIFEVMDRRGLCAVSQADYYWAKKTLHRSVDFNRVLRNRDIMKHFANRGCDLNLHRFFHLTLPRATEADLNRMLTWALMTLRGHGSSRNGQQGSPVSVGLRVVNIACRS